MLDNRLPAPCRDDFRRYNPKPKVEGAPPVAGARPWAVGRNPLVEVSKDQDIHQFPLIWRWTSVNHAEFSSSELAQLLPCQSSESACFWDGANELVTSSGLDKQRFTVVHEHSADVPVDRGCIWLRSLEPNLTIEITVSWDAETALVTNWGFFTSHWDDFCYPLSDDVIVMPSSRAWVLRFHHEEIFYFGICEPTRSLQPTPLTRRG